LDFWKAAKPLLYVAIAPEQERDGEDEIDRDPGETAAAGLTALRIGHPELPGRRRNTA